MEVTLNDPDRVLDLNRAELRWQITDPGGASDWKRESLIAGRAILDLSKHDWKRGAHLIQAKLFKTATDPDSAVVDAVTLGVWFMPPPPVGMAVLIDGNPATPDIELPNNKAEVDVTAIVDAKLNPGGVAVTVSWTGGKPVERRRNVQGGFDAVKVPVAVESTTVVMVTATNLGDDVNPKTESSSVEVRVRRKPVEKVPPPQLKLLVLTAFDHRTVTDAPYVVSTQSATVTASTQLLAALTAFEWQVSEVEWDAGKWKTITEGKWEPAQLTTRRRTPICASFTLAHSSTMPQAPDRALFVQVRAKVANSDYSTDSAIIRYDGLPDVTVKIPPSVITTPGPAPIFLVG